MLEPLTETDPHTIGGYRLQGRLGAGGMGAVYLGFRTESRTPAAVKVIRPELVGDAEFRERFAREVAAARRVRGTCVARVLDADVDAATPWMATEYVEGVSLAAAIARQDRLDGAMLTGVSIGLASALVAVHAAGLVHRDLKPSNVLLGWNGPKIIDFGIARALDSSVHTGTGTGGTIGTVAWMAPEQLRGERAGPAADVFSWALCVVFAALGRHPYPAESPAASAIRMLAGPPDLSGVPAQLVPVLRRAFDQDPARRPSAVELVSSLVSTEVRTPAQVEEAARRAIGGAWAASAHLVAAPAQARPAPDDAEDLSSTRPVVPPAMVATAADGPTEGSSTVLSRSELPLPGHPRPSNRNRGRRTWLPLTATAVALVVGVAALLMVRLDSADTDRHGSVLNSGPLLNAAANAGEAEAGPDARGSGAPEVAGPTGAQPSAPAAVTASAPVRPPTETARPEPAVTGSAPSGAASPAASPSGSPRRPPTVALVRYYNGQDHALLTGAAPAGYRRESVLGSAYQTGGVPGTHPIYACWIGTDSFTSKDANCEGQQVAGRLGWIYDSSQADPPTTAIWRCTIGGEHFDSVYHDCEGYTVEGVSGYAMVG